MIALTQRLLRCTWLLLALAALGLSTGCKSYQLGHPAELPFQTVFIQVAKNDSFAPQAQALFSSEVREAVIRDGRVKLVANQSEADAVLMLTLTEYTRRGSFRDQADTEVAQGFDLNLEAELDLYDQRNGKFLFEDRAIDARTTGYINNPYAAPGTPNTQGLIQAEYNAMPRLARELGRKAADALLGAW